MSDVSRHGSPAGRGVSQCAICASLGTWKPQLLRAVIGFSLSRLAILIALPLTLGAQGNNQSKTEDKRILWIFTNHRTAEESANVQKLTPRGKFSIAWHDTTDHAIFLQSALLAGIGQATNANPSFGQGTEGYAKRLGAAYG